MGELDKIANARIQASSSDITARLPMDMKALHHRHSVTGIGGNTIVESQALCVRALEAQGAAITTHLGWVIEEGLWASESEVNELVNQARDHLEPVLQTSRELMKMAIDLARAPKLLPQFLSELDSTRDRVWTNIDLSLRSTAAQRKRRSIRGVWQPAVNWIAKLLGLSKGA